MPDSQAVIVRRQAPRDGSLQDWLSASSILSDNTHNCPYVGVVLDESSRQRLLEVYPPIHPSRVRAHHCTLAHERSAVEDARYFLLEPSSGAVLSLGRVCEVRVYGEITDCLCQGVVVDVLPVDSADEVEGVCAHITISHDPTVSPKYTAGMLAAASTDKVTTETAYALRPPSAPLVLRGVVTACVASSTDSRRAPPIYLSHPADVMAAFQTSARPHEELATSSVPNRKTGGIFGSFSFISVDTSRVCIFDLDDTLLSTLSRQEYDDFTGKKWRRKQGGRGYISSPESLALGLPVGPAKAMTDFYDTCGMFGTKVVVLTGRLSVLKSEVEQLLASRSLLDLVDDVVCKPSSFSGSTAEFKAQYVSCMLQACPHLECLECWDDKQENLDCIENLYRTQVCACRGEGPCRLETHFVDTHSVSGDEELPISAVSAWAEASGFLASERHRIACDLALEIITKSWHEATGIPMRTEQGGLTPLVHVFGSHVLERRSDVDVMLLLPVTEAAPGLSENLKWMDRLEWALHQVRNSSIGKTMVYKATSGRVPKMAIRFEFRDLPPVEMDAVALTCESSDCFCGNITLAKALNVTVEDLQCVRNDTFIPCLSPSGALQLPQSRYDLLFGIAVRNSCLEAVHKAGLTRRALGGLVSAARRVVDSAHAMGTLCRGVRPYLLALEMCSIAKAMCRKSAVGCRLDDIFVTWVCLKSGRDINMTASSRRELVNVQVPPDLVEPYHFNRLATHIQSKWSEVLCCVATGDVRNRDTLITRALNILDFPCKYQFGSAHISVTIEGRPGGQEVSEEVYFLCRHALVGILGKYTSRWVRDGHQVVSMPSIYPQSSLTYSSRNFFVQSFGLSLGGISALKAVFPAIHKDFVHSNILYKDCILALHV